MTDQILTPREAAAYCRVSVSLLANKRMHGGGPDFIRIGRVVTYKRSALDAWLDARTVRRQSDTDNGAATYHHGRSCDASGV